MSAPSGLASSATLVVGDVAITAITDGAVNAPTLDEFFPRTPASQLDPYRAEWCGVDGALLGLHIGGFLVRTPEQTILVDLGFGWYARPPESRVARASFMDGLLAAGVWAEDVDLVLITHVHPDHIGWMMVPRGDDVVATFPNARYAVYAPEWQSVEKDEHDDADLFDRWNLLCRPLMERGQMDLFEAEDQLSGSFGVFPTPGHSPGHVCFEVRAGGAYAILIGDAMHTPLQVTEPDWASCFDIQRGDPDEAARARHALLDRAEEGDAILVANHFPFPGFGGIARIDGRRVFEPIAPA